MRIIGGSDYYDSARAFGEDRELVFARGKFDSTNESVVEIKKLAHPQYLPVYLFGPDDKYVRWRESVVVGNIHYTYNPVTIWFAGKRYRGVRFCKDHSEYTYIWNATHFMKYCEDNKLSVRVSSWEYKAKDPFKTVTEYFAMREATRSELDILIENRIGIAMSVDQTKNGEYKWHINTDGLREMKFASVIDPYQAYQELAMFVGGILPRQANPIVEIKDEKVMLAKHGMNKWSFRKHKDDNQET